MNEVLSTIVDALRYFRAIHVMAMLLVGFGFLIVFVKNNGRSAITSTYLFVSISIPLYFFMDRLKIMGGLILILKE